MKTSDQARPEHSKSRALSQSAKPSRRPQFVTLIITSKENGEELCRVKIKSSVYSRVRLVMKELKWGADDFFTEAIRCAVEAGIDLYTEEQGRNR